MSSNPKVSVVIGTFNRLEFLKSTIETVRDELNNFPHELIVIDGGSNDGTMEWLIAQKDIISIVQHNRGEWNGRPIERHSWGYFMNLGFRAASAKYICMLSDDCLVIPGAIKNGIKVFEQQIKNRKKIGAIAFYWRNWPEQEKYWVGLTYKNTMHVNHGLYLREALEKINFIDSENYFFYHADSDICMRLAQAGYGIIDSPDSYIEHYSDANTEIRSTNMERQQLDWKTFTDRWKKLGGSSGSWIEKSYIDKYKTAKRYWSDPKKPPSKRRWSLRRR